VNGPLIRASMRAAAGTLACATLCATLAAALVAQQPAFDRTKPPVLGPPPNLTLPKITERTLSNGLRLIIVEHHELPLVDMSLVVRTGAEAEPAAKSGTATLMATLMTEGADTRNSQAIAEQQAFLGVSVNAFSSWDQSGVALHTPKAVLDSALALFADVALRPTFPAAEFDKQKKKRLTQLLQVADRGPAMADRAFAQILYGGTHPYGRPLAGVESTIDSLTRGDVESFYKSIFLPNNTFIVVVGDITVADIERRVTTLFGSWKGGTAPTPVFGATPVRTDRRVYVIDKPGAPQASFRIGTIGVSRLTPDYYALQVLNTILGGPFTSRLNQHLREDKGYTYGAGSSFSMRRQEGPFAARSEIGSTKADSALLIFMKDLDSIRKPVPAAELEKAKQYLQLGLPARFETTGAIAGQLSTYALYGLPLDEPTRAVAKIGAVTDAELQRVANKYLDPSKFAIVVAGDAKSLVPMLKATRAGPVELRDSYGKPVAGKAVILP
jgi:zinc protease